MHPAYVSRYFRDQRGGLGQWYDLFLHAVRHTRNRIHRYTYQQRITPTLKKLATLMAKENHTYYGTGTKKQLITQNELMTQ